MVIEPIPRPSDAEGPDQAVSPAAATALAASLVVVTATGVARARRMTRLRQQALVGQGDVTLGGRIRRGALGAAVAASPRRTPSMACDDRNHERTKQARRPTRVWGSSLRLRPRGWQR
jgi:hypothetical protein